MTGFDYATIKYNETGGYGWNDSVLIYDAGRGHDKASSIKVHGDSIYVSGTSQFYPGGYRTIAYSQNGGSVNTVWDNLFVPSFVDGRNAVQRASVLNIDKTTGNIIVMTMSWDNLYAPKYAIRAYSSSGGTLYTIDYGESDNAEGNNKGNSGQDFTYKLSQNYPNPFNPTTTISYSIANDAMVRLRIYDLLGKEVAVLVNEYKTAGNYNYQLSTINYQLSSGVYHYKIEAGDFSEVKRMIVVK